MPVSQEKQREYQKKYRESGKAKEYSKRYYQDNLEQARESRKKYRKTDSGKAYTKAYRQTEKFKEGNYKRFWKHRLRKEYGLEEKDYEEMLTVQGNCCAICGDKFEDDKMNKKDPCIDHDHVTKKLRGILCRSCNLLLGYAKDSREILAKAISYLKQYEE